MKKFSIGAVFLLSLLLLNPSNTFGDNLSTTTCPGTGCQVVNTGNSSSIGIQITGTWVGTITFQGSVNNSTYTSLLVYPSSSTTGVTTTAANGNWLASIAGQSSIRIVFTSYMSGTAVVTVRATTLSYRTPGAGGGMGSGTVTEIDTQSPITGGPITDSGTIACDTCTTGASLTVGQVAFASGTNILTGSANLKWDGTNIVLASNKGLTNGVVAVNGSQLVVTQSGSAAVGNSDETLLLSIAANDSSFNGLGVLNATFSTDIYDGLNIYQDNTGGVHIGAGSADFNIKSAEGYIQFNSGIVGLGGRVDGDNNIGWQILNTSTNSATQRLYGIQASSTVNHNIGNSTAVDGVLTVATGTTNSVAYTIHSALALNGSAAVTAIWNNRGIAALNDTSAVTDIFGYDFTLTKAVGASATNAYAYWSSTLVGVATNPYFLWYNGGGGDCNVGGVYRVNQFGIAAYYNPCFAAYTAGATNFERLLQRWGDTGVFGTDNIAYVGVEVGGTGTNRNLNILGAEVGVMTVPGTYGVIRAGGYKSSDGTAGATVTTCTGFKNGLCISGT